MFEYLQPAQGPVIGNLGEHEVVYAEDQLEYHALRTVQSKTAERSALSRWTLTPSQRKAVAEGADIFLEVMTFGSPLQPIRLAVCDAADESTFAEIIRIDFHL